MTRWPVVLVKALDSFLKLDLLRYLVGSSRRPVSPAQAGADLGYAQTDVMKALRDFAAIGIVASCWRDGAPRFVLAAPPEARRAVDRLLMHWAGLRRPWPRPENGGPPKEAA